MVKYILMMLLVGNTFVSCNSPILDIEISAPQPCIVEAGEQLTLAVIGSIPENTLISWSAEVGTFSSTTSDTTIYIAPSNIEDDTHTIIRVNANSGSDVDNDDIVCEIKADSIPDIESPITPTATITPTQTITIPESETPTPSTPTITPSITITASPTVDIESPTPTFTFGEWIVVVGSYGSMNEANRDIQQFIDAGYENTLPVRRYTDTETEIRAAIFGYANESEAENARIDIEEIRDSVYLRELSQWCISSFTFDDSYVECIDY